LNGSIFRVLHFSIANGKITCVDVIMDPDRLRQLDIALLEA